MPGYLKIARQKETYRIPYQQNEEDRPRQCVFAGTTNEVCEVMDTRIIGWKEGPTHRFTKEGYGTQRSWIRVSGGVNEAGKEGFRRLPEGEQMTLPFD